MSVKVEVDTIGALAPIDAHYKIERGFLEAGICRQLKKTFDIDPGRACQAVRYAGPHGVFARAAA